ncbi:BTAD domain-containing putative transcriptional regulator [Amycolatopsis halotolerans]|uniref:BTAD domain-containing putative transcriptional regulator n=1 Tax=Amycolatopsis halotolerans TaxID=330083 RepID=A0ABV7QKC3_9PSEU
MRFGVLGPLHARIAGREVRFDGPRQAKMLAALLLDANNLVATGRLVAVMWDGKEPATAVRQVQDAVSGLRRNLAGCGAPASLISTRRGGYQIRLAPDQLDVLEFDRERRLAERSTDPAETAAALRRALACWRGNALADISSRVLESEAARLNDQRVAAHARCLGIELDLGRHREVVEELRVLAREHPYDEQIAEHLMVALYRCRRQGEALQAYERLRRTLTGELGVDPTPPIQALRQRVLTADPALAAPASGSSAAPTETPEPVMALPVRQLPLDVPDFVGRTETLAELARLLEAPEPNRVPVAVIAGGPGVGKSCLATHAARLASAAFPDGQLYLDLAATSDEPQDPALMLAEALRALSITGSGIPDGLSARAALYRSLLAGRRMLVVLDDAGHADQVLPLLPGAGGCAVVITSRTLLTQLPGARRFDLDMLSPPEARELFTGIVGQRRVDREPEEADAILGCCGNLPLAIRIAGAKLAGRPAWTLRVLRERLEDESRRLAELKIGDLSVRASVGLSLRLLPPDAVRALSLLGLLGACTLPGWVLGPLLDRADADEVLDLLVDANLVRLTATDAVGQPRYRLHDLIRTCAVEIAAGLPAEEKRDAIARVLASWLDLAGRAAARLPAGILLPVPASAPRRPVPGAVADRLLADPAGWFDAERDTLLAAVKLAADWRMDEPAWELAAAAVTYYDHRCRYQDWEHGHRLALDAVVAAGNARGESVLLRGLAQLHIYRDEFDAATRALESSARLCQGSGDKRGEALSMTMLGTVSRVQGHYAEALDRVEQAHAIVVAEGDPHLEAQLSCSIGVLRLVRGDLDEAQFWFDAALRQAEALGDGHRVAVVLRRCSRLHDQRGDPDEALRCLWQALAAFEELADERCAAYTLLEVGRVYAGQHDRDRAGPALERAAEVFHRHGDRQDEAACWQLIGDLDDAAGSPDLARQHHERALRLWRTIGGANQENGPVPPSSP